MICISTSPFVNVEWIPVKCRPFLQREITLKSTPDIKNETKGGMCAYLSAFCFRDNFSCMFCVHRWKSCCVTQAHRQPLWAKTCILLLLCDSWDSRIMPLQLAIISSNIVSVLLLPISKYFKCKCQSFERLLGLC